MDRRRAIIGAKSNITIPYIQNGLIFWLDGIYKGNEATKWVDLIGGKVCNLTNCDFLFDTVSFARNGYGIINGAVSENYEFETIEVCIPSGLGINSAVFYQPIISGNVGISLITKANNQPCFAVRRIRERIGNCMTPGKTYSLNMDTVIVDKVNCGFEGTDYWGGNDTGNTYLGGRRWVGAPSAYQFTGQIASIRIYNRRLTAEEMMKNQETDYTRFNL